MATRCVQDCDHFKEPVCNPRFMDVVVFKMNAIPFFRKLVFLVLAVAIFLSVSCMNAYDSRGRPIQAVDPGVAIAGAAAAGVVGYSLANDHNDRHYYRRGYGSHRGYYYGGYRSRYRRY